MTSDPFQLSGTSILNPALSCFPHSRCVGMPAIPSNGNLASSTKYRGRWSAIAPNAENIKAAKSRTSFFMTPPFKYRADAISISYYIAQEMQPLGNRSPVLVARKEKAVGAYGPNRLMNNEKFGAPGRI